MSRRGNNSTPKLELKLNLSPPRATARANNNNQAVIIDSPPNESSPNNSYSWEVVSPESSCVSSEPEEMTDAAAAIHVTTSMVLAGCPRCLMYVMLSDANPKCPKCKSTVLLDFLNEENNKKASN
ncbi:protein GL2-INTERACTING REPRESSOR 1 [Citrus sinensis]|uniref:protein GL2-INTERACTING REPRESSOR 1 n=1 Tax=Citrus sinensis TaxID=2711 RepID=UPI0003D73D6B|nr:protein GL2-INTERACTING REPRESSOR 1 [Citrus sinensis]KAH9659615.1 protein GL2-INTERACTING REPRESSOR 1 [Citrus sinensis]GAY61220.1 hypothetical protein CUMW_208150 [Citrus unshiu]